MEWKKHRLGELALSIQTGPFGSQLHQSDYSECGIPVIMPKDMINGKIVTNDIARVSDIHVQRLKRHKVKSGDIIYSRRGDVGRCSLITEREEGWLCGTGCLKVALDKSKCVPSFIAFILQRKDSIGWVENHAVGATMPNLNTGILSNLPLIIPTFEEQGRIASILSAYDNLIENNNKRIRLLEQMAENLYKEWFVRFRFPGHENAEFENGLPKGWIIDRYSNVVNISAGGDKPKVYSEVPTLECNVPIYSNGIDKDGLYGYTDKAKINKPCITISARGTVGFVCLRRKPFVPIVRLLTVVPKNGISEYYLYFSSKYNDLEGNGTSQQQLTVPMLNKRKIMIPENRILLMFHEKMKLLFNQIDLLRNQSSILSRQRDLLLPRLMSGKLEVKV